MLDYDILMENFLS
jgi:beta-amyrin synthase